MDRTGYPPKQYILGLANHPNVTFFYLLALPVILCRPERTNWDFNDRGEHEEKNGPNGSNQTAGKKEFFMFYMTSR